MSLFSNKSKTEEKGKKTVKAKAKAEVKTADKKPSMKDLYDGEAKVSAVAPKESEAKVEGQANGGIKKPAGFSAHILVKPLVTEKGSILGAENKYLFMVEINANKIDVAKAVEAAYGVKPVKVNIINVEGKTKRRGKIVGKRKDWKKAIVTLPEGKAIQVYEGI